MKLHELLAKHGHMKMAKDAKDLYEACKNLEVNVSQAIVREREYRKEIDALQEEISRLRDVRFRINQILHSANAANEMLA